MAKMFKKLQQKMVPREAPKQERSAGKDYLLIGITLFTVLITVAGWETLDTLNRAMYILLTISFALTYARRHSEKRTEMQRKLIERAGFATIGIAVILFFIDLYRKFYA